MEILKALEKVGIFLEGWWKQKTNPGLSPEYHDFSQLVSHQHALNTWHSEEDILMMLGHLGTILRYKNLENWINRYPEVKSTENLRSPVMLKPNINNSFAGIHEWLCCMITRTPLVITATENQHQILKYLSGLLIDQHEDFSSLLDINPVNTTKCQRYIIHTDKRNDSVNQYFKLKKAVIIEPAVTVAILTGHETEDDILNLGKDIFIHAGQSPRCLRKLYLPENYDIKKIIPVLEPYSSIYRNNKYANNYDYHQSVYLMNKIPFLDNGFLIFREEKSDDAPTGCLFYEYYTRTEQVLNKPGMHVENIIRIRELPVKTVKPGQSHFFNLWDYLNNKDLVRFMLE